jgi:hypothetical protein
MSRTPETDNLARGNHVVPTEFAQDLERERNEARRGQSSIQCAFEDSQDKIEEMERERDEARAAFAIATDRCVEAQSNERAAQAKSDRAEKMLRIAAAKVDEWRGCADKLAVALKGLKFFCEDDQAFASKPYATTYRHAGVVLAEFERLKEAK